MPLIDRLALVFCVVAILGGLTVVVVRALRAWRTFRAVGRSATEALAGVLETASAAEARALALTGGGERLAAATARLQESLARLGTLRAALGEAQGLARRLRGAVPRK